MLPNLDFFFFRFQLSGEIPDLYINIQTDLIYTGNIQVCYSTLKEKKRKTK
jgi:hypothetical protein